LTQGSSRRFRLAQFEPQVILMAVGWYLRFSLSYRDVEERFLPTDGPAVTSI
jgi:transposase-like protein